MAHCSVPFCTSDRRKAVSSELSFSNFPKDKHLRRKWIAAIRRDVSNSFQIGRNIILYALTTSSNVKLKEVWEGTKRGLFQELFHVFLDGTVPTRVNQPTRSRTEGWIAWTVYQQCLHQLTLQIWLRLRPVTRPKRLLPT
ncbi:uncharacterized protein LOC125371546 isoform X2 [Haliotis rufescens]|uniref:uncharacterized protein LOC125371546 isoform X2 n=1 Tax=Haliotis rufescens TaxID=6454 RepID=UPI001EB06294|nr:uncharacterized protein LOC125371546 isoform X2 [Haliotis rufescens]